MKNKLILIICFFLVGLKIASANSINITPAAYNNLNFYAPLFNMSIGDFASQILSAFTTPVAQVTWNPLMISSSNVTMAVIQQISINPFTYSLVRVLSTTSPNTGTFNWIASSTDSGSDKYIEVGCVKSDYPCQAFSLIPNP